MSTPDATLVGKRVQDMHGAPIGHVVGTITDIDGTVQTVGVDRGSGGLEQIPHHQLVVQPDVVIYIPMWRLDSQKLLREKELALRRIKALMSIVRENDDMREDAEIIHEKYRAKIASLDELQERIRSRLESRLAELDTQLKSVKTLIFDARVQNKSGEIDDGAFESVKSHTSRLVEQITREHSEITAVQRRITDLSVRVQEAMDPEVSLQDSAASYLGGDREAAEKLPEAPTHAPQGAGAGDIPPRPVPAPMGPAAPQAAAGGAGAAAPRSGWLARMESQ